MMNKNSITLSAHAKINLFLDITGRRADGYHTITGIMHAIGLCDYVTVTVSPKDQGEASITLTCDNPNLPTDSKNLGYRAAAAYVQAMGEALSPMDIAIDIQKRIPAAAGLAGGSTDAAAVLRGLNTLLNEPMTAVALRDIGLTLGADVPFCLAGGTQMTQGVGEQMTPLPLLPNCPMVIACGGEGISTPWAYQALDEMYQNFDGSLYAPKADLLSAQLNALARGDLTGIAQNAYNIFESVVLHHHSTAQSIKAVMQQNQALLAMMSGSGPSVFGIFPSQAHADTVVNILKGMNIPSWVCRGCGGIG